MRLLTVAVVGLAVVCGGCKKPKPAPAVEPVAEKPAEPKIDDRNTNFRKDGSVLANAVRAGKRADVMNDMHVLGQHIVAMYLEPGRMPTAAAIKEAMKKDAPKLYKLIDEGVIILTGTTDYNGLWAYEIDADKAGGVILVAGAPSRASAAEVKQHLGKK